MATIFGCLYNVVYFIFSFVQFCQSLQCSNFCVESANASSLYGVNESIWRHFHFNIDSTQQTKIISNASLFTIWALCFIFSFHLFFSLCFVRFSFNALRYLNNQCISIQCIHLNYRAFWKQTNKYQNVPMGTLSICLLLTSPLPHYSIPPSPPPRLYCVCMCMRSIIRCTKFLSHLLG